MLSLQEMMDEYKTDQGAAHYLLLWYLNCLPFRLSSMLVWVIGGLWERGCRRMRIEKYQIQWTPIYIPCHDWWATVEPVIKSEWSKVLFSSVILSANESGVPQSTNKILTVVSISLERPRQEGNGLMIANIVCQLAQTLPNRYPGYHCEWN